MKWGWVVLGLVAVSTGIALVILRKDRKPADKWADLPKGHKVSEYYEVQPIYKLPETGLEVIDIAIIDDKAVEAVKTKHGKFVLCEAYMGPKGLYLVETHPDFPGQKLAFLLTPKE